MLAFVFAAFAILFVLLGFILGSIGVFGVFTGYELAGWDFIYGAGKCLFVALAFLIIGIVCLMTNALHHKLNNYTAEK